MIFTGSLIKDKNINTIFRASLIRCAVASTADYAHIRQDLLIERYIVHANTLPLEHNKRAEQALFITRIKTFELAFSGEHLFQQARCSGDS